MAALERMEIGPGSAALSFSSRLARENGWPGEFAGRVVVEYKRFVFLAMKADHPVTPSEAVDQAWHLHLCYTRSYWEEMCGRILPRALHHGPTLGGAREDGKFREWYAETMASYERFFGGRPPPDIWPGVAARFEGAGRERWVDGRNYWIVRKPRLSRVGLVVATGVGAVALAGCARVVAMGDGWGLMIGFVVCLVIFVWLLKKLGGGGGGGGAGGCGFFGGGCGSDGGGSGCGSGCGGCGGGD